MIKRLLFDKRDMTKVMEALDQLDALSLKSRKYGILMGNCGWAKAPDCWFIYVNKKKFYEVGLALTKNGVILLPEDTGR